MTSIPLPQSMYAVARTTALWTDAGKRGKVGNLAKDVHVGVLEKSDPKQPDWNNVVGVSGPLIGKSGWVPKSDIQPFAGPALP